MMHMNELLPDFAVAFEKIESTYLTFPASVMLDARQPTAFRALVNRYGHQQTFSLSKFLFRRTSLNGIHENRAFFCPSQFFTGGYRFRSHDPKILLHFCTSIGDD